MSEKVLPKKQRPRGGQKNGSASGSPFIEDKQAQNDLEEDEYSKGYDFLLVNKGIEAGLLADVMTAVSMNKQNSKIVLIIVTYGGVANEAYRVARYLQSVYDEVVAFVPSICKSAGTLIVTAAHRVVISAFGEIGPLDVQLVQRDEIYGRRSGLTTRSALDDLKTHTFELFQHFMLGIVGSSSGAVTFKLAAEISAKISSEVMSRVYEQVNPDSLGQDFRDLSVATKYCELLHKRSRNLRPGAIRRLVHDYPSHDFVIDAEEAKEIFERLELPTAALYQLMVLRATDVIIPKSPKGAIVEMLTIDGKAVFHDETVAQGESGETDDAGSARETEGGNARGTPATS